MSRIGKLPITVPPGVKVTITECDVTVEGKKGKLFQDYKPEVSVTQNDNIINVNPLKETKQARSYHGLYRTLINNMVKGVSEGFSKTLIISGVGYRAEVQGKSLILSLGYSNQIEYVIDDRLTITCETPTKIIVSGIDKQQVGQTCAEIRSLRRPEPYKGKGIRYETETIRRKVGKSGSK